MNDCRWSLDRICPTRKLVSAQVDFPEIDVRQRLTVSKGYGVSEIYVPEGSKFVGQTIAEVQQDERDINVLTLYRDAKRSSKDGRLSDEGREVRVAALEARLCDMRQRPGPAGAAPASVRRAMPRS